MVRAAGPFASLFLRKTRRDIVGKFEDFMADRNKHVISEYIYHCNSAKITGEYAFHSLLHNGPWPRHPIGERMKSLNTDIPLTFVYGGLSWIDNEYGFIIKQCRPQHSYTHIEIVESAGHKVFSDNEMLFNSIVLNACKTLKSSRI